DDIRQANIGEIVTVTLTDGTTLTGELLIADTSEIALQTDDGVQVLRDSQIERYTLPIMPTIPTPPPSPPSASLELLVDSDTAGEKSVTITYLTGGIRWTTTDYNLLLGADNTSVSLGGWVTISNATGIPFVDADVTLASGGNVVQRVQREVQFVVSTAVPTPSPTPALLGSSGQLPDVGGGGGSRPVQQPDGLVFQLDGTVSLPANGNRLVGFLDEVELSAENVYVYDASPRVFGYQGFNTAPTYGITEVDRVQNFLELSVADGTDFDLPAGNVRIYRETDNGAPLLAGSSQLPFTPSGEAVQLFLDSAGEITGERRQTEFQVLGNDGLQESYEIRLSNRTEEDITVLIPERLTRSPIWEIAGSSLPFEQPDNNSITFEVVVPA
ncbi:MAG: hypothetical protein AAF125_26540, partial [Chloroflexota bacterium]